MPNTNMIARKFDELLKSLVGEDNYREIVQKNRTPEYSTGCCASHDYCDANLVMNAAVYACGIDPDTDEGNSLWNRSWEAWRAMTR